MRLVLRFFTGDVFLLTSFFLLLVFVWLIPVFSIGYPPEVPATFLAKQYSESGVFGYDDSIGRFLSPELMREIGTVSPHDGRLSTMLIAYCSNWIAWDDFVLWTTLSSMLMAFALIFWWGSVRLIFNREIAWVSTIILCLFPVMWGQAIFLHNFQLAFFFFMASLFSFVWLRDISIMWALIISGVFFGASTSAKDVFLIVVPWYVFSALWIWRKNLLMAAGRCILFFGIAFFVYSIPYFGDIQQFGYPLNLNLARFWPGASEISQDSYLHLYPDPYTYYFDKDQFDSLILMQTEASSVIEKIQNEKTLVGFGLVRSPLRWFSNGIWLFVNSIPSFFHQNTIGGSLIWLFILPGVVILWRRSRRLFWMVIGLVFFSYLEIRMILHYNREHIMDFAWVLALLAACGVSFMATQVSIAWKNIPRIIIVSGITLLIALHLLQVNRLEFGNMFRRSSVPQVLYESKFIYENTPNKAVIAIPEHPNVLSHITLLSNRTTVLFRTETVKRLLDINQIKEAFTLYGITHIWKYPENISYEITSLLPDIEIVPEVSKVVSIESSASPFLRFLLNIFR